MWKFISQAAMQNRLVLYISIVLEFMLYKKTTESGFFV